MLDGLDEKQGKMMMIYIETNKESACNVVSWVLSVHQLHLEIWAR